MRNDFSACKGAIKLKLTSPKVVKALLAEYELRPSKGLGQNFLINEHSLQQIVAAADVNFADLVLEIGPGLGVLTQQLAVRARRVIAIEKDQRLLPPLQTALAGFPQVELLHHDALDVDYEQLIGAESPVKVVANLPYSITTPLLIRLLAQEVDWAGLVLLVQTEVAERMVATAGNKQYGLLSVLIQCEYEVNLVGQVPASAFYPAPKVESTVVKLQPRARQSSLPVRRQWLGQVVRAAFGQRRKTLLNALSAGLSLPKSQIADALIRLEVSAEIRGESLTPPQFVQLATLLA